MPVDNMIAGADESYLLEVDVGVESRASLRARRKSGISKKPKLAVRCQKRSAT